MKDSRSRYADIDVFVARITSVILGEPSAIRNVGSRAAPDGHAAVAKTSPVSLDALLDFEPVVNRQSMLVAPEPDHRPVNDPC
jgi:hypothetical protein